MSFDDLHGFLYHHAATQHGSVKNTAQAHANGIDLNFDDENGVCSSDPHALTRQDRDTSNI